MWIDRLYSESISTSMHVGHTGMREHTVTNRSSQPRYVDNRNLLTRAQDKKLLLCPKANTELMKKSVLYNTAKHWNNLRLDEQQASHYSSFKAKSKRKEIDRMLALQQS